MLPWNWNSHSTFGLPGLELQRQKQNKTSFQIPTSGSKTGQDWYAQSTVHLWSHTVINTLTHLSTIKIFRPFSPLSYPEELKKQFNGSKTIFIPSDSLKQSLREGREKEMNQMPTVKKSVQLTVLWHSGTRQSHYMLTLQSWQANDKK